MSYVLEFPTGAYKYRPLKQGLRGQDIFALQLNLNNIGFNLAVDGIFGSATERAVTLYQKGHRLTSDGIAGIRTQESLALVNANPFQREFNTPGGLLRGLIEGESGWMVGAVSARHTDGSRDIGWMQRNIAVFTEDNVTSAFDAKNSIQLAAEHLRAKKNQYHGQHGATTNELAWKYAVLYHNWPAAADHFAAGSISTWDYSAEDNSGHMHAYTMDDPADWVINIGVPNVSTGYQWANFYIQSKVKYVKVWTD